MRSKRLLVLVSALVACLAIGSATVATAKQKTHKITTTITLTVTATEPSPYAPYTPGSATASGRVKAKGPSGCKKGRTVTIFRNGVGIATVVTGPNGDYAATISGDPSGTYQATVAKRVINKKKKEKKFICKAATTGTVVIP